MENLSGELLSPPAYLPNDNTEFFENNLSLLDWLRQFVPVHYTDVDEDFLRGFLGKMLLAVMK